MQAGPARKDFPQKKMDNRRSRSGRSATHARTGREQTRPGRGGRLELRFLRRSLRLSRSGLRRRGGGFLALDGKQLDLEDQGCAWRNLGAGAAVAVSEIGRNKELPL